MKNLSSKSILSLAFLMLASFSFAQEFDWGVNMGSTVSSNLDDEGKCIATDAIGNVYTYCYFDGSTDFDPGSGTAILNGSGMCVQKLTAQGSFVWAKKFPGNSTFRGMAVAINGDVYITGEFSGTADFDPNVGTSNLSSLGGTDIFAVKLDTDGDLQWAVSRGTGDSDYGNGVATDAAGNAYFAASIVENSAQHAHVFKLNSSDGGLLWTQTYGNGNGIDIAVNTAGDVFATGYLTPSGTKEAFLKRLDPSTGNPVYSNQYVGDFSDCQGYSIDFDAAGNTYLGGIFKGMTIDFDLGADDNTLISDGSGAWDSFITKVDNMGNHIWAKRFGGSSNDYLYTLTIDSDDNIYATGLFSSTVDFDPGPAETELSAATNSDVFILKLTSNSDYIWVQQYGNQGWNIGNSVYADEDGNIYTTGVYYGTFDFDPGTGVTDLVTNGGYDIFITKQAACETFISTQPTDQSVIEGTNVQFTVEWSGSGATYQWQVDDGTGFIDLSDGGDVAGSSTSTLNINNTNTLNHNSYRCKVMEAFCGGYSNIAVLEVNSSNSIQSISGIGELKVYPNPTQNTVILDFSSDKASEIRMALFDIQGKTYPLPVSSLVLKGANLKHSIDLSDMASGSYFIQLTDDLGIINHTVKVEKL